MICLEAGAEFKQDIVAIDTLLQAILLQRLCHSHHDAQAEAAHIAASVELCYRWRPYNMLLTKEGAAVCTAVLKLQRTASISSCILLECVVGQELNASTQAESTTIAITGRVVVEIGCGDVC